MTGRPVIVERMTDEEELRYLQLEADRLADEAEQYLQTLDWRELAEDSQKEIELWCRRGGSWWDEFMDLVKQYENDNLSGGEAIGRAGATLHRLYSLNRTRRSNACDARMTA